MSEVPFLVHVYKEKNSSYSDDLSENDQVYFEEYSGDKELWGVQYH